MRSISRSLESLVHAGLTRGMASRITHYFEYCWIRHRDFAKEDLITEMPSVFRRRVALQAADCYLIAICLLMDRTVIDNRFILDYI